MPAVRLAAQARSGHFMTRSTVVQLMCGSDRVWLDKTGVAADVCAQFAVPWQACGSMTACVSLSWVLRCSTG